MKNATEIEVYFDTAGNTVVGNYFTYATLDGAMRSKSVFHPHGYSIRCESSDFARLVEYVQLFGHCIKTLAAFQNACKLSGIELVKIPVISCGLCHCEQTLEGAKKAINFKILSAVAS